MPPGGWSCAAALLRAARPGAGSEAERLEDPEPA